VVRILGEQIDHSLADVVHLVVYDDQVFFCGIQGVEIWQSSGSLHIVGSPFYQRDFRTNRKWKIRLCQEMHSQHSTHDDALAG
jgi:hypothetical protein